MLMFLTYIIKSLLLIIYVMLMVAFYTILERKIIAYMQRRTGPNLVGPFGLLQAIADGLKLLVKKTIIPQTANIMIFIAGPLITFNLSYLGWCIIPFDKSAVFVNTPLSLLYLLSFSALSLYGLVMAGWASNSKYAFFGAIRATAQMISYEVSFGLILICIICSVGTLNLNGIVLSQMSNWFILAHFPIAFLFFISALAETNRAPFDLPEAEAELVSGYNTEYAAMGFALFFLGEYANMILMCSSATVLFLGGWLPLLDFAPFNWIPGVIWFGLKVSFLLFVFIWVRASFPRYRYDQLMRLGWKVFLPLSFAFVLWIAGVLIATNGLI